MYLVSDPRGDFFFWMGSVHFYKWISEVKGEKELGKKSLTMCESLMEETCKACWT